MYLLDMGKILEIDQFFCMTREEHGELFRVSDQHNREYGILEIQGGNSIEKFLA